MIDMMAAPLNLPLVVLLSAAKKYTPMEADMISGVCKSNPTNVYHHGRYSLANWKKVTIMRMIARKKMNIAMKITPHLIGKHPKQVASPTLS